MSVDDILKVVQSGGVVGLLVLCIVALWRRWIVFGYQLAAEEQRALDWKNMALSYIHTADRTLDIADMLKEAANSALEEQQKQSRPPPRRRR